MDQDANIQKRLLATFAVEAQEHLKGITSALIELEQGGTPQRQEELLEKAFREAHSLKGAARAVNLVDVEGLCQGMEGIFAVLKRKEAELSQALFDLLQRARDLLDRLLQANRGEGGRVEASSRSRIIAELAQAAAGGAVEPPRERGEGVEEGGEEGGELPPTTPPPALQPPPLEETVRVSTAKLNSLLLLSEEMVSAKLSASQHVAQMRRICSAFGTWRKEWGRFVPDLARGPLPSSHAGSGWSAETGGPSKVTEFLEWNASFLKSLGGECDAQVRSALRDSRLLGGMVDNLLEEMKSVMMFPFSSLLEAFPKIVRDLSRDYGKEVNLVIRGEEIEIDRRILEVMKDPFLHLARNCISHGIERGEEREARGKPRRGELGIGIQHKDGKVEIAVSDDGAGVDIDRLRAAVQRLGIVSGEQAGAMSDAEMLPFVFQSGVSTNPLIDEISGRGLGLAIVREKVEKLGGAVSLESEPGRGTSFRIVLPLSVATFRGILIRVADRLFVIPASHVELAVRVRREEIRTVQSKESITLNGKVLALARLGAVLELPAGAPAAAQMQAVIVNAGETSIAFVVDEVLGEQEVLQKNFGAQLSRVRNVAGATLLGSGKVVPILNVTDLLKAAARGGAPTPLPSPPTGEKGARRNRILVVEDSITSRTLLKNILEAAGYDVATAVDGLDGFSQLRSGGFDLVVSDVDMPRMDGFELTRKIRHDRELAQLPVVLVTSLGSREDRERGIDAGANAYIVKASFDQSNLLETVQRFC